MELKTRTRRAFTLLEVMIVVLCIGILLAIAVPNLYTARQKSRANAVIADLQQVESAKQQYAMSANLGPGAPVNDATDLVPYYINSWPQGPVASGVYSANPVNTNPTFMGQDRYWFTQHCTGLTADSACPL